MMYCFNCGSATVKGQMTRVKYNFLFSEKVTLCPICRHLLEKKLAEGASLREATKHIYKVRGK